MVAPVIPARCFMQYDLGFFDHEMGRLESIQNPLEARVLPMSPV
jgi:hypothetical protein